MKNYLLFLSGCLISLGLKAQPTSGLVAHYLFNGNANDISGNSHNGIVHGATLTSDQFGNPNNAFLFNGTSDYIELPTSGLLLNNYTYSFCLKPISLPPLGSSMMFFSIGDASADQYVQIPDEPSLSQVGFTCGSYWMPGILPNLVSVGSLPATNTYYNIVVTRSNTSFKLYVNSVLINSVPVSSPNPSYGSNPLARIGVRADGTYYFHGVIDDVLIYNRELAPNEIQSLCINPHCN